MNTTELIQRREFKYLIDEHTADRVRAAIQPFCELDSNAAKQPSGRYLIDSCYFDSPGYALYRANVISLVDRYKVRVRGYPPHAGPVFFEVKGRFHDVISKTRGKVPREIWASLVSDPSARVPDNMHGPARKAVERFLSLVHANHMRPVTMVRYEREPYMSRIDSYARVTFDRKICSKPLRRPVFDCGDRGWRWMDNAVQQKSERRMTVLELKFTTAVPRWMFNLVRNLGLQRLSFSKYATSVDSWLLRPQSRIPKQRGSRR